MTEGMPPLGLNLLHDLGEGVVLVLRIILALLGALLGWWLTSPLVKGISRLAFRRRPSAPVLTVSRLSGAVLVALALFYFFPLGFGGGGTGGGLGEGVGTGSGAKGPGQGDGGRKDGKQKQPEVKPGESGETVRVEMILASRYEKNTGRYYLIESKAPPKTLEEVDQYLNDHKGRFRNLDIIIYANSVDPRHSAVQELEKLADGKYKLRPYIAKEYLGKEKPEKSR
jgi:hypothetical protein